MTTSGNGAPGLGTTEDVPGQTRSSAGAMDGSSSSKVTGAPLYRHKISNYSLADRLCSGIP